MSGSEKRPRVAIFAPDCLLSVAIEAQDSDMGYPVDELHVHAAGQGVWVARMAAEMGAVPVLCSFVGGESGLPLGALLEALPGERRLVATAGSSGCYITDRRAGAREIVASALRPAPQRHEVDDLVTATVTAALASAALVICNPYPAHGFPDGAYETIAADVKAAGVPVLVDLSTPRLDRTLAHEPDLVKLNDWELAEYVRGPVDGSRALVAAQKLRDAGAKNVVVTRGGDSVLVVTLEDDVYEIQPPTFPHGFREGCGDTMMGATAAGFARGLSLRDSLVLGAAAGSVNFMRHGLGTGSRAAVEELAQRIKVRGALRTAA